MVCDNCRERDAVVHLTQVVEGAVTQVHLCEKCAADKGVETTVAAPKTPLTSLLQTVQQIFALPAVWDVPVATAPSSRSSATCCSACMGRRATPVASTRRPRPISCSGRPRCSNCGNSFAARLSSNSSSRQRSCATN